MCIGFALLVPGMMTLSIPAATAAAPEVEMTGFTILQETDSGRWEIESAKARYDGAGDVLLTGVTATLKSPQGSVLEVVSDRGRFESDRLLLHLEGNVGVTSALGASFEAPRVRWDGSGSVLDADGGVRLTRGPLRVTGSSVRYVVSTGTAFLGGGVKSVWSEGSLRH
ncbi:MAG: LPS export ABC transporter periplasmic protein LptC [bacterium]|nr:LPS export ABC transporter periplasmic protein LptC [bacterium]